MAPRIEFPERGMGEHVDWTLLRTDMAIGMGQLSEAVYGDSQLPVREREAARWTIALDQPLRGVPGHPGQGRRRPPPSTRTSTPRSPTGARARC